MQTRSFIGMNVHKATISISVAEDSRSGPVRFLGVIPNTTEDVAKMAKQLAKHGELDFCYEASGCGYGIHRQQTALGHKCIVVAPSMLPRKPGERIKTDRRDSESWRFCTVLETSRPSGSGHYTRSAPRPGPGQGECLDASHAGASAVARLSTSARPQLRNRQALDATPSYLAGSSDLRRTSARHRVPGLPRDRMDRPGPKRCPDQTDLFDDGELVAWTPCRCDTWTTRYGRDLRSHLRRFHRRPFRSVALCSSREGS